MRFWDASAVVPLLIIEPHTPTAKSLLDRDSGIVMWWGTSLECSSALARSRREDRIDRSSYDIGRKLMQTLQRASFEIQPSDEVRHRADRLLGAHALRAADALQLAAALIWCQERSAGAGFVCLDRRLRQAVRAEGFDLSPKSSD